MRDDEIIRKLKTAHRYFCEFRKAGLITQEELETFTKCVELITYRAEKRNG